MQTYTVTFGNVAENHVGMDKIQSSTPTEEGLNLADLMLARDNFSNAGYVTELLDLVALGDMPAAMTPPAWLLKVHGGIGAFGGFGDFDNVGLQDELMALDWDTKAFMYGRVVNKKARHNLCFGETASEPAYEAGRGRVVAFESLPTLNRMRTELPLWFGPKAAALVAEGNHYYDVDKCGIGFHGDSERCIVIAARVGASMPLDFRWYSGSSRLGSVISVTLGHGDMYAMSEKAVGQDWKTKSVFTLRHAAGAASFRA